MQWNGKLQPARRAVGCGSARQEPARGWRDSHGSSCVSRSPFHTCDVFHKCYRSRNRFSSCCSWGGEICLAVGAGQSSLSTQDVLSPHPPTHHSLGDESWTARAMGLPTGLGWARLWLPPTHVQPLSLIMVLAVHTSRRSPVGILLPHPTYLL